MVQSVEVSIVDPVLGIGRGEEDTTLTFSAANLLVGQEYELWASDEVDFTDSRQITSIKRTTLYPTFDVWVGNMGSKQFFRLVEAD